MFTVRDAAYAAAMSLATLGGAALSSSFAEMTVEVGGAPMYPSKNIIENAVNSKDHTTLLAAGQGGGSRRNLARRRTVHGFRAGEQGFREAAKRDGGNAFEARK
jgi:hypothetical protein